MAIITIGLCSGCSDRGGIPIEGDVTFNGKPVEEGTISFSPADGKGPTSGGKIVAGHYQLTGNAAPLPGMKTVRISGIRKTGRKVVDHLSATGAMMDEIERYIPNIYNTRSTLSCKVDEDGQREIDFHLKSP